LIVFSVVAASMYAALHETLHGTAFRSRRLNHIVAWLAAAPIYYTPTGHGQFHFTHHRHTQDPLGDPEISPFGTAGPPVTSSIFLYLMWMTGLPILLYRIGVLVAASIGRPLSLWEQYLPFVSLQRRRRLRWEARLVLSFHALLIFLGLTWLPGLLYLLPGQLLGIIWVTAFTTADHQGLPHQGTILERTRSVETNSLVRFLMWNMSYHAEHHAYPAVPFHALPRLHAVLQGELKHEGAGYLRFHRRAAAQMAHGMEYSEPSAGARAAPLISAH
jgi:fatty acid desaturase